MGRYAASRRTLQSVRYDRVRDCRQEQSVPVRELPYAQFPRLLVRVNHLMRVQEWFRLQLLPVSAPGIPQLPPQAYLRQSPKSKLLLFQLFFGYTSNRT